MWRSGNIGLNGIWYVFEILVSEHPSKLGIFGGKIEELHLYDENDNLVAEFNKKWIVSPKKGSDSYKVVNKILKEFNFGKEK